MKRIAAILVCLVILILLLRSIVSAALPKSDRLTILSYQEFDKPWLRLCVFEDTVTGRDYLVVVTSHSPVVPPHVAVCPLEKE